jgi:N-acetylglutamate synthase-like GNAT family acetyltransferase
MKETACIFSIIKYDSFDYTKAVALREKILRNGKHFSQDELDAEKEHIHIAGFVDGDLIATCSLIHQPDCKIKMQRVAVREDLQGKGLGSNMVQYCGKYAADHGISTIYVHARDSAISFYLKNGYVIQEEIVLERGKRLIKYLSAR